MQAPIQKITPIYFDEEVNLRIYFDEEVNVRTNRKPSNEAEILYSETQPKQIIMIKRWEV